MLRIQHENGRYPDEMLEYKTMTIRHKGKIVAHSSYSTGTFYLVCPGCGWMQGNMYTIGHRIFNFTITNDYYIEGFCPKCSQFMNYTGIKVERT